MKNKTPYIFIIFISITLLCQPLLAQSFLAGEDIATERDPFKSWLPKIEEKIIEKDQEPTKIEVEPIAPVEPPPVAVKPPEPVKEIKPPKLKLNGLVWNTKNPQAIINNEVVSVGDIISESEILDIRKDGVDIMFSNKFFTITIEQPLTKSS